MSFVHRQLLSWFLVGLTLALLVFRLDRTTVWSWYIVFVPAWVLDAVLVVNIVFRMFTQSSLRYKTSQGFIASMKPVVLHCYYLLLAGLLTTFKALLCHNLRCHAAPHSSPHADTASTDDNNNKRDIKDCIFHWYTVFTPLIFTLVCLCVNLSVVIVKLAKRGNIPGASNFAALVTRRPRS